MKGQKIIIKNISVKIADLISTLENCPEVSAAYLFGSAATVYLVGSGVNGQGCKIQNNVSVFKGITLDEGFFCGPSIYALVVGNPARQIGWACECVERLPDDL
jgi:hypothetical protein